MSPIRMSRIESAVRVVIELIDALNRHDTAVITRLLSDDVILECAGPAPAGTVYTGKAGVTGYYEVFFRNTPYARIEIEEIFGSGNRCVARWRNERSGAGGESKNIRGVDIFRVKNGFICEILSYIKGDSG